MTAHCEFDAAKYREASAHQHDWGTRLIADLNLHGNETVLDLGCGDGRLTAKLAQAVPRGRVIGIDSSRAMISAAQSFAAEGVSFLHRDINHISFEQEFDLIFSNATLHWLNDHRRLLWNAHRALRPGGICRFNFAAAGNCATLEHVVRAVMRHEEYQPQFTGFEWPWFMPTIGEYKELVATLPFVEYQVWGENADRHFPDADAMTRWIDQPSLVPFLAALEETARRSFRDEVVTRMTTATKQPDGRHFETFRGINVVARRGRSGTGAP